MAGLRPFAEIYDRAAARKGGPDAFEVTLPVPADPATLAAVPDDRWLSQMSQCVFQAGFNWKVVRDKWPRFEDVFDGFEPARLAMMTDEDIEGFLKADGIVRHGKKIASIRENAAFVRAVSAESGSFGKAVADWPGEKFADLVWMLKKRGSRLGGTTGMMFLRFMDVDGYILGGDVQRALIHEGVIDGDASSRRDLTRVQDAVNIWRAESNRPLMQISRILACSID